MAWTKHGQNIKATISSFWSRLKNGGIIAANNLQTKHTDILMEINDGHESLFSK